MPFKRVFQYFTLTVAAITRPSVPNLLELSPAWPSNSTGIKPELPLIPCSWPMCLLQIFWWQWFCLLFWKKKKNQQQQHQKPHRFELKLQALLQPQNTFQNTQTQSPVLAKILHFLLRAMLLVLSCIPTSKMPLDCDTDRLYKPTAVNWKYCFCSATQTTCPLCYSQWDSQQSRLKRRKIWGLRSQITDLFPSYFHRW